MTLADVPREGGYPTLREGETGGIPYSSNPWNHGFRHVSPYHWTWRTDFDRYGDAEVIVTQYCPTTGQSLTTLVASYTSEEIRAELEAHWCRNEFAHVPAEGKLKRELDVLCHRLEDGYGTLYDQLRAKKGSKCDPPQGIIDTSLFSENKQAARVTGLHADLVQAIAWHIILLGVFAQAKHYDQPYGHFLDHIVTPYY